MRKLLFGFLIFILSLLFNINFLVFAGDDLKKVLDATTQGLGERVYKVSVTKGGSAEKVRNFLVETIGKKIMIPIIVSIGLILGFIAFYKLKFSDKEEEQNKAANFLTWGTIGIIIMVSATFVVLNLVNEGGRLRVFTGVDMASNLYDRIIFPFLKLAMFIVVGILFVILLIHTIRFIFSSTSEEVRKHSQTIIIWNIIGILIILGATDIVELVYGKKDKIESAPVDIGHIGQGIMAHKNLTLFYHIINYLLSFVAFIVLLIVIYQAYLLLVKPEDENMIKSIKRNFVYIFLGLVFIAAGYLITNFLIIR